MAKIRNLLNHIAVERASRARLCHRNRKDHRISASDLCLVVFDSRGGRKNYCRECARPILDHAEAELGRVSTQLQLR